MRLNLRQIEVFRAIMITGSISGAARLLSVSQPAISRLLAYTEDGLKLQLFERVRGRVQPTPEARRLFAEVDEVHRGVLRINDLADELRAHGTGSVRVVASPSAGHSMVPDAVAKLRRRFSDLKVEFESLTLQEIIAKLAAVNITADRKTLYTDFEDLRQFGFDIIAQQRDRTTYYHLGERDFELPELKLLVDSVQAAKFITTRKSQELIRKLERYASVYQAAQLNRQVYIAGRVKAMNESIYYNIDRLHSAINAGVQIRFQYGQWNLNKEMELRRGGDWYQVSPWALTWDDEKYYLVAYDADVDMIKHYRVDKMLRIKALDEPRQGQKAFVAFDMALYSKSVFGMFTGEETTVTLEAENHMVGVIIDRFGKDISLAPVSDTRFQATVNVIASPQFIGWIVALGKSIRIVAPDALVERMREEIHRLSDQYDC